MISRPNREAVKDFAHRSRNFIAQLKSRPCADCGGSFPSCVMDFDHVRGAKFAGVGQMMIYSRKRLLREVAKCDIIYSNCHRIRTAKRHGRL